AGGIRERLDAEVEEMYRGEALTALLGQAEELEFPPVLVEREIDRLLRDEARAAGHDVDHYLEQLRKPVQEIRDVLRAAAEERVRRSLALTALAEAEQI